MTEQRRFTAYAENKRGTNNKFYEVEAIETEDGRGQWIFRWGRIGTNGQSKEGTTYSFSAAKQKCEEQFAAKKKRGYREVSPLEALASAAEDVTERKRNGLSEVHIIIPRFHAGTSEPRCRKFCEKYQSKLNVIRGSRWDMDYDAYTRQIETLLKQYKSEWARIKASGTHGSNLDGAADTAARIFFNAMVENAGASVYVFFPSGAH